MLQNAGCMLQWLHCKVYRQEKAEAPFTRLAIFVVPYAYFTYDEANVRKYDTFDNQRHLS